MLYHTRTWFTGTKYGDLTIVNCYNNWNLTSQAVPSLHHHLDTQQYFPIYLLILILLYISRQKRQAPYMIFPEILVIVDYDGYR